MKKNILILLLISLLLVSGCGTKKNDDVPDDGKIENEPILLKDHENYKDILLDDIDNIERVKFTVAGDNRETFTDRTIIEQTYNSLFSIKLGEKTEMACSDNTTVYVFNMKNGDKHSIEIECDWVIIGKNRYLIVK